MFMKRPRILCVHDHRDICDLICTILADYEVVSTQTKEEGLRAVERGRLYLLDHSIPDGAGFELATLSGSLTARRQFSSSPLRTRSPANKC